LPTLADVRSQARRALALGALLLVALAPVAPAAGDVATRGSAAPWPAAAASAALGSTPRDVVACAVAAPASVRALAAAPEARAAFDPAGEPADDAAAFATPRAPATGALRELRGDPQPPAPPSRRLPPAACEPARDALAPQRFSARPVEGVAVPACRSEARWCRARGSSTSPG